ncbi:MAG TPA: TraB/GumN family protein [Rhizomicrobium sp.]|jgi:hypothetical protein
MRWRDFVLAGAVSAGLTPPAEAQSVPAPPPIETITVIANGKGPAIWHATKNGADVAILGIVTPLPDGFAWNARPLETDLNNIRRVLLPPQVRMGVFSGVWFYLTKSDLLHPPDGKSLSESLDPHVAADLARISNVLHESKDRYNDNAPILAAMRLGSDFRHVDNLTTHEPEDRIATLARARRILVRRIADYDLIPSGEELLKLPPAATGTCIEAEIEDIEYQSRHVQAAASAWAIGDVSGMLANWAPSHYYACLISLSPHATALDARSIDDTVASVTDAMTSGGRTLAIVPIGILLRKGGVIDRLKAEGIAISGP